MRLGGGSARKGGGPYGQIAAPSPYSLFPAVKATPGAIDAMNTTKQSSFAATLRTTILLATLSGLLVVIGALIGGPSTAGLFLAIALLINLGSYFFSDKLALKMSGAKPIDESEAPRLYQLVRALTA